MLNVKELFDPATYTLTYIVFDSQSKDAVIIDPVWDYDPAGSKFHRQSFLKLVEFISQNELKLRYILETHAHADHVSSSQLLKSAFPEVQLAIGERITMVQEAFKKILNWPDFPTDGSQFDRLLKDGEVLSAGSISIKVLFTPGHTPACVSYLIEDRVFCGDALFMPDYGTGRCDFPLGSASELYRSITQKIYTLPDATQVYTGHDYQPGGRPLKFMATVGEQKKQNIHLKDTTTEADYVKFRTERDRTLSAPKLLLPSVQINIAAGHLPPPESNGVHYLKIPLTMD